MSALLSVVCLAIVGVLCAVGVFHHRYDDTLGERVGMSIIGLWCLMRLPDKLASGAATEPVHLLLHVGMASFALGMAWAKWRAYRRAPADGEPGAHMITRGGP